MNKDSYHNMKRGLALSLAMHAIFLGFGIVHFTSVVPLPKPQMEAVPITLALFGQEMSSQKGALNAPVREVSAVKPTTKLQTREDALHVGDGQVDSLTPFMSKEKPRHVETMPEESLPVPKTSELIEAKEEVPLVEPQEIVQQVMPKVPEKIIENKEMILMQKQDTDVQKIPVEQPSVHKQDKKITLPDTTLFPQFKPKLIQQTATQDVQDVKEQNQQTTEKTTEQILEIEEKNLLNHARTQGGGAKRSSKPEALGARKDIGDTSKMVQTLVNIAGGCIQNKLKLVALGGNLKNRPIMRLRFYLNREGMVIGDPVIEPLSGEESQQAIMARQVYAAVFACQPYADLPRDQYNLWGQGFDFNVDPLQEVIQ